MADFNPDDYDPASFASIMRRAFANVLHSIPQKEGEDGQALYKEVHGRIHRLREKCLAAYNSQDMSDRSRTPVTVQQIGIAALNRINKGKSPESVCALSNGKLLKQARKVK